MTTILALARGRLRPVPWGWLAVLAAGWLLLTDLLAAAPRDPQLGVMVFRWAGFLLGLGGVVLAAPETDPPRDVLRAAPVPLWETLALRLAGWLALGSVAVLTLAVRLGGTAGWTAADLASGALPNFLLATAAGFLAANLTSALGGGAAAMAAMIGLDTAARVWLAGFPIQLRSVPGAPHWQASRAWMVAASLALIAVALLLEARVGARFGLPRRRRSARPGPASEARAGP
jgi:hypothetical protein